MERRSNRTPVAQRPRYGADRRLRDPRRGSSARRPCTRRSRTCAPRRRVAATRPVPVDWAPRSESMRRRRGTARPMGAAHRPSRQRLRQGVLGRSSESGGRWTDQREVEQENECCGEHRADQRIGNSACVSVDHVGVPLVKKSRRPSYRAKAARTHGSTATSA